jgi:Fe2+ transport system protein B
MLWPNNSFNISVPEGLSYMVMIMLMTSCMATMAVLKKEGGWKNLGISLMSSFGAAYIIAAVVYWTSFLIVR